MKHIPMTITVHTNKIPFEDYGNISVLGETMNMPLMRCKYCDKQPEFSYDNQKYLYFIRHECEEGGYHNCYARSYKDLTDKWNKERGKHYGKSK